MFQRGFKSWCENISLQQRKKLGVESVDPLDPYHLACSMNIVVWKPEDIPDISSSCLDVLLVDDPDSWSAITISISTKSAIVINSSHSVGRTGSNLMHELSHVILGHEAARVDVSKDNLLLLSTYDKKQEDEANWLAGCMLLPREALVHIRRNNVTNAKVKKDYFVSEQMLNYRMRIMGVEKQFRNNQGRKNTRSAPKR